MTTSEARALPYEQYLLTEHWLTMRRLALDAAGRRCLLCDAESALQVHHRTYERLGAEQLRDLIVLCDVCHGRHHEVFERAQQKALESAEIGRLRDELMAEMRGAEFLAAEVSRAWVDGRAQGRADRDAEARASVSHAGRPN